MAIRSDKQVLVCDRCLTASCWYGEHMCGHSTIAGLIVKTVGELREIKREHQSNWTNAKFLEIYGEEKPDFSGYSRTRT